VRFVGVRVATADGYELVLLHHSAQPFVLDERNVGETFLVCATNDAYEELGRRLEDAVDDELGPRVSGVRVGGIGPRESHALTAAQIRQYMDLL
jgi:hypothetical protein